MPHQCTNCDRQFPDGSKEMLSGCPGCGGNKFQFLPSNAVDEGALSGHDDEGTADGQLQFGHASSGTDDQASADGATVDGVTSRDTGDTATENDGESNQSIIDADARAPETLEDTAQADARRTVISEDELRTASEGPPGREEAPDEPAEESEEPAETPDLSALREELNEQFESIKILEPGQYELNLMELYDREEYIVALEEDGRYAIEVPDSWREGEE